MVIPRTALKFAIITSTACARSALSAPVNIAIYLGPGEQVREPDHEWHQYILHTPAGPRRMHLFDPEPKMRDYQYQFLEFALSAGVLKFGEFTLKSGRVSPYFFNAGLFNSGASLARLGDFYAQAIVDADIEFDLLFGPAYKGIPLAAITAAALFRQHGIDVPYAFNRKEVKNHGEGGSIVGHALMGKVMIIDDVITAGTAIRESMEIIDKAQATPAGVVIALDRQERGKEKRSAIQEVEQDFGMPVAAIVKLEHIVEYLKERPNAEIALEKIEAYRESYGADRSPSA